MPVESRTNRMTIVLRTAESWKATAQKYVDRSNAGLLTPYDADDILGDCRHALEQMAPLPRTAAVTDKAVVEFGYNGDIVADIAAIETELRDVGNWVAARGNTMWNNFSFAASYPWATTVPTFTAGQTAGLRTELNGVIAAINVLIANAPG